MCKKYLCAMFALVSNMVLYVSYNGWKHPYNGFLLLGSSIAEDVAHDTKKGSRARAQEGINSSFASAFAFAFAYLSVSSFSWPAV